MMFKANNVYHGVMNLVVRRRQDLYKQSSLTHFWRLFMTAPCRHASMAANIRVKPASALVDEQVAIAITGLNPGSTVTLRAQMGERKLKMESHAHYIADMDGNIDLREQPSIGGSYVGVEPMGLFWSMQPSPGQQKGLRFIKADVDTPVEVNLTVHRGLQDISKMNKSSPMSESVIERWYKAKNVERIPIRVGRVRGELFKPKGDGPFPGVIDMFGIHSFLRFRASLLASRGFASLALPFIGYEDLPSDHWGLELEYFQEASEWLSSQPYVTPGGVGVVGTSTGGQYALQMASYFPETIKAAISVSGFCMTIFPGPSYNGQYLEPLGYDTSRQIEGENAVTWYPCFDDVRSAPDNVFIPVERAQNLLFIVGKADLNAPTLWGAQRLVKRLQAHGHKSYELVSYPGAGHLIEPPYSPFCRYQLWRPYFDEPFVIDWGGNMVDNARAQEDSWPRMLQFLRKHIGQPQTHK